MQYTEDADDTLPRSWFGKDAGPSDPATNYKWMDAIFPYVKSEQLFICPSDSGAEYIYNRNIPSGQTSRKYGSYGQNGAYRDAGDSQTPPRSAAYLVSLSAIPSAATTVWATDTNNRQETNGSYGFSWANALPRNSPSITTNTTGQRQLEKIIERHLDTTNVLYCDGHVKALRLDTLARTKSLIDPLDGMSKDVMTQFTIEDD